MPQLTADTIKEQITIKLRKEKGIEVKDATTKDIYYVLASLVNDEIRNEWMNTNKKYTEKKVNLSLSTKKQKLIELILQIFGSDIPVVLEGIESEADFNIAKELGIPLVQGYHFGKPNLLEFYMANTK